MEAHCRKIKQNYKIEKNYKKIEVFSDDDLRDPNLVITEIAARSRQHENHKNI